MRLPIPPLLPPYGVLFLVVAYAFGSLWLGLERLDAITRLGDSTTRNRATLDDLHALQSAVDAVELAGPVVTPASAEALSETSDLGRRRIPALLSALRDKLRDDASELALVEELVPLIAERTTYAASSIERKRTASDPPQDVLVGRSGSETSGRIRAIIDALKARNLRDLELGRETRIRTIAGARQDLFIMAGVTLLLVMALFLAVRRLRSFLAFMPSAGEKAAVEMASDVSSRAATDVGVGTLLRDAALRARLAAERTPTDSDPGRRLRSLNAAIEQALDAHAAAYDGDPVRLGARGLVRALAMLVQVYSHPDTLAIKATIDQSAKVQDAQKVFLVFRSAEWALEAIALRKRAGNVTCELMASEDRVFLRIHALTDNPRLPVTLTPKENEEANALRQGVVALAGTFVVGEGPTGFSLSLTLPADT